MFDPPKINTIARSIVLLFSIFVILPACSIRTGKIPITLKPSDWQQIDSNEEWSVHGRTHTNTNIKEYMITGLLSMSPREALHTLIEKTLNAKKYGIEQLGSTKILEQIENEILVYSVYPMPLFFNPREMCERFIINEINNGEIHVTWQEEWIYCPAPSNTLVRMNLARGEWRFVPADATKTHATYRVHADLGGLVPESLNNLLVKSGLSDELNGLQEFYQQHINNPNLPSEISEK